MNDEEIERLPSVTEILGKTIAPKEELLKWVREVEGKGQSSLMVMQKAAERGTKIHNLISLSLMKKRPKLPKQYEDRINTVLEYLGKKRNIETEVLCWKDGKIPYKGHIDYLYEDERGIVVSDLKTGNRIQKTYDLQLFGYKDAIEFSRNIKINALELLHITPDNLQVIEVPMEEGKWNCVLELYSFLCM